MTAVSNSRLLMTCTLVASLLTWPLRSGAEILPPGTPEPDSPGLVNFGGGTLNAVSLDRYRGGTDVVVENTNNTDGAVYGNRASNLVTGSNLITEGSFAGANGISTVVQNSGNNVLIQAPVIVNLQVQ